MESKNKKVIKFCAETAFLGGTFEIYVNNDIMAAATKHQFFLYTTLVFLVRKADAAINPKNSPVIAVTIMSPYLLNESPVNNLITSVINTTTSTIVQ